MSTLKNMISELDKIRAGMQQAELVTAQVYETIDNLRSNIDEYTREEMRDALLEIMDKLEEI